MWITYKNFRHDACRTTNKNRADQIFWNARFFNKIRLRLIVLAEAEAMEEAAEELESAPVVAVVRDIPEFYVLNYTYNPSNWHPIFAGLSYWPPGRFASKY